MNPAVTVSMWSLKKIDSYTEAFVRIAGQMGGGLLAFPLFDYVSDQMGWEPFGGPEFSSSGDHPVEEALSEFFATFLLMWAIYIVSPCVGRGPLCTTHLSHCRPCRPSADENERTFPSPLWILTKHLCLFIISLQFTSF